MFKKVFGPKKIEGKGTPVAVGELKEKLLELLPSQGEVNQFLSIEPNKKSPDGFSAVWQFYSREQDMDNMGYMKCQITHSINVNIDPNEKSVRFKTRHFAKSARIPKGEMIYEPWHRQVKIGKLADLKIEVEEDKNRKVFKYSSKKALQPLIDCVTDNGWDAYAGIL